MSPVIRLIPRCKWRVKRSLLTGCDVQSNPRRTQSASRSATYREASSPPNVVHDIVTPPSSGSLRRGGIDSSDSDRQYAHRQMTFQCRRPVRRLRVANCCFACGVVRTLEVGGVARAGLIRNNLPRCSLRLSVHCAAAATRHQRVRLRLHSDFLQSPHWCSIQLLAYSMLELMF